MGRAIATEDDWRTEYLDYEDREAAGHALHADLSAIDEHWGEVLHAVRTGETGLQKALGVSEYEYLAHNPEEASHFNAAMIGFHGDEPAAIVEAYDFSGIRRLVDVGGGSGNLLGTILTANPNLRGVLLDRPQVVPDAERNLSAAGVADRCQVVGGDFLEAVPDGGDAYIVSHCIHNWDEPSCVRILTNCRRAMEQAGRLLIIEAVVRPGPGSPAGRRRGD